MCMWILHLTRQEHAWNWKGASTPTRYDKKIAIMIDIMWQVNVVSIRGETLFLRYWSSHVLHFLIVHCSSGVSFLSYPRRTQDVGSCSRRTKSAYWWKRPIEPSYNFTSFPYSSYLRGRTRKTSVGWIKVYLDLVREQDSLYCAHFFILQWKAMLHAWHSFAFMYGVSSCVLQNRVFAFSHPAFLHMFFWFNIFLFWIIIAEENHFENTKNAIRKCWHIVVLFDFTILGIYRWSTLLFMISISCTIIMVFWRCGHVVSSTSIVLFVYRTLYILQWFRSLFVDFPSTILLSPSVQAYPSHHDPSIIITIIRLADKPQPRGARQHQRLQRSADGHPRDWGQRTRSRHRAPWLGRSPCVPCSRCVPDSDSEHSLLPRAAA